MHPNQGPPTTGILCSTLSRAKSFIVVLRYDVLINFSLIFDLKTNFTNAYIVVALVFSLQVIKKITSLSDPTQGKGE